MTTNMLPKLLVAFAVTLGLAAPAAQAAPPVVHASATDDAIELEGAHELRPGVVTLRLTVHSPSGPRTLALVRMRGGADAEGVAAIDTRGLRDVRTLERVARLVSGAVVRPGVGFRTAVDLPRGRYAVIELGEHEHPYAAFNVRGARRTDRAPAAGAALRIADRGFLAPRRLASTGSLRIANAGDRPHRVLAARIGPDMTSAEAERLARRGRVGSIGATQELLGLVSAGTVNTVRYALKPGRWVVVSTYGADARRGLVTTIVVR